MTLKLFNQSGELVDAETSRVEKSDDEWQKQLTPQQFTVARGKGTERPFCGTLLDNKIAGVYSCICCGLPLFSSDAKFNSGTGWPSFSSRSAMPMSSRIAMQRMGWCGRRSCVPDVIAIWDMCSTTALDRRAYDIV